ncbi:hypothetical protein HYALB_00012290 [Hymenoscyphus albidus]|uniref:Uncharacterized protein n=1 Tax=Hymenoscyphus albidus TaxID=595503 RepID=A0A9N9LKP7_9HELO|nr:hypothetical protein HYALB_00012290 [Hymenoscyphus albidus]
MDPTPILRSKKLENGPDPVLGTTKLAVNPLKAPEYDRRQGGHAAYFPLSRRPGDSWRCGFPTQRLSVAEGSPDLRKQAESLLD